MTSTLGLQKIRQGKLEGSWVGQVSVVPLDHREQPEILHLERWKVAPAVV